MRVTASLVLSIIALLVPAFAISEPVQNQATTTSAATLPAGAATPPSTPEQSPAERSRSASHAAEETRPETVVVRGDMVDLNQVVCKKEPPKTGSRLGGGVECHTQRQWNQRMRESQDVTRLRQIMGYHQ